MQMEQLIENFPNQIKRAIEIGESAQINSSSVSFNHIFISGLGGSGIGGTIFSQIVADELSIPILVNKDYSLPAYIGGINALMDFLKEKSKNAEDNEAVHLWIFSDSSVVPKSFSGEWSNPKNRKKCFAHAVKLANGNYSYDFDIFGEYKPEE